MTITGLPDDLRDPLLRLWQLRQPIHVQILPCDAWVALGIIQYSTRNPMLTPEQRQIIESFGRSIQRGLAALEPALEQTLEMGWNPAHDVPREG
jgi:hypothetical protein